MADLATLNAIETGELIVLVNGARIAGDPFKLPEDFFTIFRDRLTAAKAKNAAATMTGAATVGAGVDRQQALARLADLLRSGYRIIAAVLSNDLSDAARAQCFAAYGWDKGELGDLESPVRLENLARLAVVATADVTVPTAGKYPATLTARIAMWLAVAEGAQALATGGTRQTLIQQRNDARDLLLKAIARVRHFTSFASDDTDHTLELAKYGLQPRREAGDAQPQALPDPAGAATFDAATRVLSVPAMPEHATFLRAFRQAAGGQPEAAGVSNDRSISVVAYAPLTPGVAYEFWVVGVNSRGEGPASNKVSFHA